MAHLIDKYQRGRSPYGGGGGCKEQDEGESSIHMCMALCVYLLMKAGGWGSSWDWGTTLNVHVLECTLYSKSKP